MGCGGCECNHLRVFPEVLEENAHDETGGACSCDVPEMGEENIPNERGVAGVLPEVVEENTNDAKGGDSDVAEPESVDHEG